MLFLEIVSRARLKSTKQGKLYSSRLFNDVVERKDVVDDRKPLPKTNCYSGEMKCHYPLSRNGSFR